ncbi:MAG TPA: heavy metal-responsive transcriptional regulator [Pyrinomonadaceae bacterium]|nr:heavy metal-responsive transcriptional regulator [Pyrinomonadaceae bacterium]
MRFVRSQHTVEAAGGLMKIGEVARRSGVGVEALRFYEKSGLLDARARTEAGYRLYDESALERLNFIRRAQTLGFTLTEIRQIIADSRAGQSPCAEVREVVRRRLAELDERMREMRRYRDQLAATLAAWDATGEAEGHVCGLIEATEPAPRPAVEGSLKGRRRR